MDLYVAEGYKALFRIGIALIASYKKELKVSKTITDFTSFSKIKELSLYQRHPIYTFRK